MASIHSRIPEPGVYQHGNQKMKGKQLMGDND